MILIHRKRKATGFLIVSLLIVLISLIYEHKRMDLFLKDPLYELMEFDPGFSSVKNIIQAFSELAFSDKAAKAADVISQNTQGFPERPPIERIDIDIKIND